MRVIKNIRDLKAGDTATIKFDGGEYTGPVVRVDGELYWAGYWVGSGWFSMYFKSATRPKPKLPIEPLAVITDVVTHDGAKYPFAVFDGSCWVAHLKFGRVVFLVGDEIVSFELGKVVTDDT